MKKKTAQPRRKQRKTSVSEKKKGLIAQKKQLGHQKGRSTLLTIALIGHLVAPTDPPETPESSPEEGAAIP